LPEVAAARYLPVMLEAASPLLDAALTDEASAGEICNGGALVLDLAGANHERAMPPDRDGRTVPVRP
jgi:hypothetical protein